MEAIKPWWKSRTIYLNATALILTLIPAVHHELGLLAAQYIRAHAVLSIYLRFDTDSKIGSGRKVS